MTTGTIKKTAATSIGKKPRKISIIIPAWNEMDGIGQVLDEVRDAGFSDFGYDLDILVVDNNSSDSTSSVAASRGSRVISEPRQGKGHAIRTAFANIPAGTDFVVMLDADGTYKPREIPRLLEPLESDFADCIIGSRLGGHVSDGSMYFSHRLANWLFTFIVRHLYRANVTDVCSGFIAWRSSVVENLRDQLVSPGFAIETEMLIKKARMGYRVFSVPITYEPRQGTSKLAPVGDGLRILYLLGSHLWWQPSK